MFQEHRVSAWEQKSQREILIKFTSPMFGEFKFLLEMEKIPARQWKAGLKAQDSLMRTGLKGQYL